VELKATRQTRLRNCRRWSGKSSANGGGYTAPLNAVAQMRAERAGGSLVSFRQMQEQAREVDRRRVEIAVADCGAAGKLRTEEWPRKRWSLRSKAARCALYPLSLLGGEIPPL